MCIAYYADKKTRRYDNDEDLLSHDISPADRNPYDSLVSSDGNPRSEYVLPQKLAFLYCRRLYAAIAFL